MRSPFPLVFERFVPPRRRSPSHSTPRQTRRNACGNVFHCTAMSHACGGGTGTLSARREARCDARLSGVHRPFARYSPANGPEDFSDLPAVSATYRACETTRSCSLPATQVCKDTPSLCAARCLTHLINHPTAIVDLASADDPVDRVACSSRLCWAMISCCDCNIEHRTSEFFWCGARRAVARFDAVRVK